MPIDTAAPSARVLDSRGRPSHNATKQRDQRGHLLVEPNLVAYQLARGRRACRACDRALDTVRYWAERGVELDVDVMADEKYAELMGDFDG